MNHCYVLKVNNASPRGPIRSSSYIKWYYIYLTWRLYMSQFGLEGESLFHLGQRCFLWSAQHDGYIYHQTQQGGTILEREGGRKKGKKMNIMYSFTALGYCQCRYQTQTPPDINQDLHPHSDMTVMPYQQEVFCYVFCFF